MENFMNKKSVLVKLPLVFKIKFFNKIHNIPPLSDDQRREMLYGKKSDKLQELYDSVFGKKG